MTILPKSKKTHIKAEHRDRGERRIPSNASLPHADRAHHHIKPQPNLILSAGPSSSGNPAVSLPKSFGGTKKVPRRPGVDAPQYVQKASSKRRPEGSADKHNDSEAPNSDDEYGGGFEDVELELAFVERMKAIRGFVVKEVKGDGACMFRAVADQIYGDEEMHHEVRRLCMDYVAKNRDHFSQFITEEFNDYLARKRLDNVHGNHVELQAMSEIFLRPIEVFEYSTDPINTFHPISREANTGVENPPIRLSYHGSVHYNSVVDPFTPTVGVGLGLPEYHPGLADKNLMKEATQASERQLIEDAMLKDKMRMTDWELTEDELNRQIASESYMDYLKTVESQNEVKRQKSPGHEKSSTLKPHAPRNKTTKQKSPSPAEDSRQLGSHSNSNRCALGGKRGASSPNLPSSSRDIDDYRMPKMYKNDFASTSMPNIDADFGQSLSHPNPSLLKPSTSSLSLRSFPVEEPCSSNKSQEPGEKQEKKKIKNSAPKKAGIGLYEELLASSASYGDWNSPLLDETALLAQALALSQQEFLDSLEKNKSDK